MTRDAEILDILVDQKIIKRQQMIAVIIEWDGT